MTSVAGTGKAATVLRLEAKAEATKRRLSTHQRTTTDHAWIIERARDIDAHLDRTTGTSRIRLIHLLVKEITFEPTTLTVSYHMPVFRNGGTLPGDKEEIGL